MPGQVVTFYSHQGGVGRSMTLANVGWILSQHEMRVLAIDWHLSAPSLHVCLEPYLDQDQLRQSSGLIAFLSNYLEQPVGSRPTKAVLAREAQSIHDCILPLNLAEPSVFDFLPAGRHLSRYPDLLRGFNQRAFYDEHHGAGLLSAVRDDLIEAYDYVLIDCRDGMEDNERTAAILPPDAVVLCLDMTQSSLQGAMDAARSVDRHRRRRLVRYFPVPVGAQLSEHGRVDTMRRRIRESLGPFLRMSGRDAEAYWAEIELVRSDDFYSDSIVVADAEKLGTTLARSFYRLAGAVTAGQVSARVLTHEAAASANRRTDVDIRFVSADRHWADWISSLLEDGNLRVRLEPVDVAIGGHAAARGTEQVIVLQSAQYVRNADPDHGWNVDAVTKPVIFRLDTTRPPHQAHGIPTVDLEAIDEAAALDELRRRFELPSTAGTARAGGWQPRFPRPGRAGADRPPVIQNLPTRNPQFVGRGATFTALRNAFLEEGLAARPRVLIGSAGAGKTQLAQEFAHRFAADYDVVWWISAENTKAARAGLHDLTRELDVSPGNEPAVERLVATLQSGQAGTRWLLIFDDVEHPGDIDGLVPAGGHVLMTSRYPEWADEEATPVEVPPFTHDEAVGFLRVAVPGLDDEVAARLLEMVGGLPLALGLASAYVADAMTSAPAPSAAASVVEGYLERLDAKLAGFDSPRGDDVRAKVTWLVSLDRLSERHAAAAKAFEICTFLGPEAVPLEILESPVMLSVLVERDPSMRDPLMLGAMTNELVRLGMAKVDSANRTLQIHRVLQVAERERIGPEAAEQAQVTAYRALATANRGEPDRPENWQLYHAMWPHAYGDGLLDMADDQIRQLLLDLMRYRYKYGDYVGSERLAIEALEEWRGQRAPDNLRILRASSNLANCLRRMGRFEDAHDVDEYSLGGPLTVMSSPDGAQGTVVSAIDEADPASLPYVLIALRGLAADYRALGRYQEALDLDRVAWARYSDKFGVDNAETLKFESNLADSYRMVGKIQTAAAHNLDVWDRRRNVLGESHPYTHFSASSHGRDLRDLGDLTGSKRELQAAFAAYKDILGPDHPDTLRAAKNLAVTLRRLCEFDDAHALSAEALTRYNRRLGPTHPETLVCRMAEATTLAGLERNRPARQSAERAVKELAQVLDECHAYTLMARNNVAVIDLKLDQAGKSLPMIEEVHGQLEDLLGEAHPVLLVVALNLANHYAALRRHDEACLLDQQTLEQLKTHFDEDHPDVIATDINIAIGLRDTGDAIGAAARMQDALERAIAKLGKDHDRVKCAENWMRWRNTYIDPPPF